MLKSIVAVIVGYVVMFVTVFVLLSSAYLGMGTERAFQPGSYEVSVAWLAVMLMVSALAAVVGGKVCRLIARGDRAVYALGGLVLVLGLLSAIPALTATGAEPKPRTGDVANLEAMMNAKQPAWVALLLPVIGVAGVFVGGRSRPPVTA
jgi:hypothetical protein